MNYKFKTNDFEGPLDLLLHLIKESKMDIMDIKIVELTDQYINYINNMEEIDLQQASEYLILAAELTLLKSKLLVPNKTQEDEDELTDAKEELVSRLLEYQNYKELTGQFKVLEERRKEMFTKTPSNLKSFSDGKIELGADVTLEDLLKAFQQFLERKKYEEPITTKVTTKEISVEQRSESIRNILKLRKKVEFFDLFEQTSKPYVIVTFLSVLEMAKKEELKITQENNFDKIYCEAI